MATDARPPTMTKTIPLAGGMQDDVPEFLQDHPSLAYIENGRFRKTNEVEKRLPNVKLTDTNLPSEGAPLMLAENGNTLITLDEDGTLYTLDPGSDAVNWGSDATNIIPYAVETERRTGAQPGMGIFTSMATAELASKAYTLTAWEERKPNTTLGSTVPDCDLVIELRRPDGSLMDMRRISGGRSPKMTMPYRDPVCFFIDGAGDVHSATEGGNTIFTASIGAAAVETDRHDIAMAIANSAGITYRDDLRVGFTEDGGHSGMYTVGFANEELGGGILFYRDTTFRLFYQAFTSTGSLTGSPTQVEFESVGVALTPLACTQKVGSGEVGLLFTEWDAVTQIGFLVFEQWTSGVQTERIALSGTTYVGTAPRFINASLEWESTSGNYRFATTLCGGDMASKIAGDLDAVPMVLSGSINTSTNSFVIEEQFYNHRLASEITFRRESGLGAADMVLALEQWAPHSTVFSPLLPEFASLPVLTKPVTTVVVAVPQGNPDGYKVLATLGAGQNKSWNASSAEQSPHLNGAHVVDDEPRICIRNIYQPEDISIQLGDRAAPPARRINVLFPGEAEGKVVKLTEAPKLNTRTFGNSTLFASGVPTQYDGAVYGESGVFDQPEVTFVNTTDSAGLTGWAYEKLTTPDPEFWDTFQVVIGFTDKLGQLHRSAPSVPVWVSGLTPSSTDQLLVGFTAPLSAYRDDNRTYFVEVYQADYSDAGGGVSKLVHTQPYVVGEEQCLFLHNVTNNNTPVANNEPLRFSEILYTTGNVLPSDPWPTFTDFTLTSNRMFAVSAENPGTIYYSKLFEPGIAPEFSAALVIDLGRNRTLQAIGAIDDKVLVFTRDEIFAIYDTGPDNTGANGTFIVDRLQATVGCEDAESLVEIPDGLFFYSSLSKEFHLISRDLQIVDIGKAVEDTAGDITDVLTAVVVPDEHEVRWYVTSASQQEFGPTPETGTGIPTRPPRPRYQNKLPTSPALVYNYHYKKWCVHSDSPGLHAVMYQGQPTFIIRGFDVYQADPTAWGTEANNRLLIRTPWIRVGGLQSLGRVKDMVFLGKYLSDWRDNGSGLEAGDAQVTLTYDYAGHDAASDVYRFRANRGDFGTERMQFKVTPGRQKCQAVQIEVEEVPTTAVEVFEPTYAPGRGFALSGVDVLFIQKQGTGAKTTDQRASK